MKKRSLRWRRGTTATEVIVAATLLLSMFGLVVPTTIRAGRVLRDARHYQMAMNELSNQFEYLSSLSDVERATALQQLQASEQTQESLSNVKLAASIEAKEDGVRLTLSLNWDRGLEAKPMQITGWLNSSVADSPAVQTTSDDRKEGSNEKT